MQERHGQTGGSSWRAPRAVAVGAFFPWWEAEETGLGQPGAEMASGAPTNLPQCLWGVIEEVEPDPSQWCKEREWDKNMHKWNVRVSDWIVRKTFLPWGQSGSRTGYPERCSLPLWRLSTLNWNNPSVVWSDPIAYPVGAGGWTRWPLILWSQELPAVAEITWMLNFLIPSV